jgi:CRP/FNR family transcriptional regulator
MHDRPIHARGSPNFSLSLPPDIPRLPCHHCLGRSLGICAPLDNQGLASLVAMGGQRRWDKRELLYHGDDPAAAVYKITKGVVIEYCLLTDGRRQIVAIRSVGDLSGYPARAGHYGLTAEAVTPVVACAFGTAKFHAKVEHSIEFACAAVDEVSERFTRASLTMTAVGQLKSVERVARFIVEMEALHRKGGSGSGVIPLHLSRQDIADYIGMTLETVSRSLTTLKNMRLMALVGIDAVSILDEKRLRQVAKEY